MTASTVILMANDVKNINNIILMNKSLPKNQPQQIKNIEQTLRTSTYHQQLLGGKVVLTIGSKQSRTGMFTNKRLLVYNGRDKTVCYSNQYPKSLPLKSFNDLKFIKKSVPASQIQIVKSKSKLNAIQIKPKQRNIKNEKNELETWIFAFKSAKMCEEVFQTYNEAIGLNVKKKNESEYSYPNINVTPPHIDQTLNNSSDAISKSKQPQQQFQIKDNITQVQNLQIEQKQIITSIDQIRFESPPKPLRISFDSSFGRNSEAEKMNSKFSYVRMNDQIIEERKNEEASQTKHKIKVADYKINLAKISKQFQNKQDDSMESEKVHIRAGQDQQYQTFNLQNIQSLKKSKLLIKSKNANIHDIAHLHNSNNLNIKGSNIYSSMKNIFQTKKTGTDIESNNQQTLRRSKLHDSQTDLDRILHEESPSIYKDKTFKITNPNKNKIKKKNFTSNPTDWNDRYFYDQNPYEVLSEFKDQSLTYFKDLVDQYLLGKSKAIIDIAKNKYSMDYKRNNIVLNVSCYYESETQFEWSRQKLLNQFQDYKYLNSFMKQKDIVRVPLVSLMHYKGFTAMSKAVICLGKSFNPEDLKQDFAKFSKNIRLSREHLKTCCKFFCSELSQNDTVVFVDDLNDVLPKVNGYKIQAELAKNYIKKRIQQSMNLNTLNQFRKIQIQSIITHLNNFTTQIISSRDLADCLEQHGVNDQYLGEIYQNSNINHIKELLLTEMIARTSANFIDFTLQKQFFERNPEEQITNFNLHYFVLLKSILEMMEEHNVELYNIVWSATKAIYKIDLTDYFILPGYLFSALIQKGGLVINYESLDPRVLVENKIDLLNLKHLEGFKAESLIPFSNGYETMSKIVEIIENDVSEEGYQQLKDCLENHFVIEALPNRLLSLVILYCLNFQPFNVNSLNQSVDFYNFFPISPPTITSIRVQYNKVKWCLKSKQQETAVSILENVCELLFIWLQQFHSVLSEFYDVFSTYYMMIGWSKRALTLAKSSVVNMIKIVGKDSTLIAEKYYLLANIQNVCKQYQQALVSYQKVRQILSNVKLQNNQHLVDLMLKMAGIYLCLGDFNKSFKLANEIVKLTKESRVIIQCHRIVGQIYKQYHDTGNFKKNASLCYNKFQYCDDCVLYSKVLKIAAEPYILELSDNQLKALLEFTQTLDPAIQKIQHYSYILNLRKKRINILEMFVGFLFDIQTIVFKQKVSKMKKISPNQSPQTGLENSKLQFLEAVIGLIEIEDTIE